MFISATLLLGCEAPLVMDGVLSNKVSPVRRTDIFMSAVTSEGKSIIVGSEGVVISADSGTKEWQRNQLEGKPALIDITSCSLGLLAALTMGGEVWTSTDQAVSWKPHRLTTEEVPQAITCDKEGAIWVVGSFSTILSSSDSGESWVSHSLEEDMILSTIQFLDESKGIITGEFGTVLITEDGGETWSFSEPIPNEFFPLASIFKDSRHGWVVGLNSIIYSTNDGGSSWQQQETATTAPLYGLSIKNDEVIAVGDYGTIIHKNINSESNDLWETLDIPVQSRSFFRIGMPIANNHMIIAGGAGTLEIIDLGKDRLKDIEIK